jgi:hypothetical protein
MVAKTNLILAVFCAAFFAVTVLWAKPQVVYIFGDGLSCSTVAAVPFLGVTFIHCGE